MKGLFSSPSARGRRTSRKPSSSPQPIILQSHSDPLQLNSVNSDDSSVFSGLGSVMQGSSEGQDENKSIQSVRSVRFQDEQEVAIPRKQTKVKKKKKKKNLIKQSHIGKYIFNTHGGDSNSSDENSEFISVLRSAGPGSVGDSDRSALRNLSSVADNDSAFMDVGNDYRSPKSQNFLYDYDASTMSYGSVNEFERPIGTMKLLSDVQIFDGIREDNQENGIPRTPDGAEEFTNLLKSFEKEMDASISGIRDEDELDDVIAVPYLQDVVPKQVKSDDGCRYLSYGQAKQMQRVLHQARKEVEILRDNNEQFMSEIEQTEEEHESEMKLLDERTKLKFSELKSMYQEEIDCLIQEKDAAIVEAGRQAVRYSESGRKQITRLKKQIERLKLHAQEAVKKAVEEAALAVKNKKDNEMNLKLRALQKSHEEKMDIMKGDTEAQLRDAVNEAVANVTQKMLADREREVKESVSSIKTQLETDNTQAVQLATDDARRDAMTLRQEQDAMLKALESIMNNINNHYPEQMEEMRRQNRGSQNPMRLLQAGRQNESPTEKTFKEVIEAFAFLLEMADGKIRSAQVRKERSEVYIQARHDLMIKHRTELEYARKQAEDAIAASEEHLAEIERLKSQQNGTFEREESKEKIQKLEQSLKTMGREKRALQEKFRRDADNHRNEVKQLKDKIRELENGREKPQQEPEERHTGRAIPGVLSDIVAASREMRDDEEGDRNEEQTRESNTEGNTPETALPRFGAYPITSPMSSLMSSEFIETRSSKLISDTFTPVITATPPLAVQENLDLNLSLNDKNKTMDSESTDSPNMYIEKKEPTGSKEGYSPSEVRSKRKNFGILRGFKNSQNQSCSRDPSASSQGREPEGKTKSMENNESNEQDLHQSAFGIDGNKVINDNRRESTSSLRADVGVATPLSKSLTGQSEISTGETPERNISPDETISSSHARAMKWKKKNPLGMFAHRRRPSSPSRRGSHSTAQNITSLSDESHQQNMSANDHSFRDRAINGSSQLENVNGEAGDNKYMHASREVMNNPLSGFDSKSSDNNLAGMNVINGKKPPLPEWSHAPDGTIFTQGNHPEHVQVPATIDVQNRNDQQSGDLVVNGHTMCLRPHSVNKKSVLGGFTCGSGNKIGNHGSSSGTLATAPSTDDDAPPRRVSQQEMREFPPLGDQSDDESRDGPNDKYSSFELPLEYVQETNGGQDIPIVKSRSVDDSSPVIYMDPSNDTKPIVVQGQPIHRKTTLSAFTKLQREKCDASSTTGSEATTTITAHTFRSAYNNDQNKLRDLHHSTAARFSESGRRKSTFAAMKARRARRHVEM